jgi:hypothetical protein
MLNSFPRTVKQTWLYRFGAIAVVLLGLVAQVHAQCANPANAIVAENCLTGSPSSQWDTNNSDAGDLTIQGFATDISANQGSTVNFKIKTNASAYTIDIYRMGYYGGMGARKVASVTPSAHLPQTQPACLGDTTTGLTDCGNWAISASWPVPVAAVSGVYFAHLVRTDTGGDSHIVFIVRNDSSHSDILYQTSDTSWQAYNYYGNGSLYGGGTPEFGLSIRSYKVSYNRPFLTRSFNNEAATYVFGAEFATIQFLEQNGFDVSYSSGVDTARSGALIKNHKIFMDSGHDEYVSSEARASIQAARDAGVNLAFFSGNEVFWKTRWENSIDGSNTTYRTVVCYKETLAFAKLDPQDPPTWTGTWRDPSFSPPADGGLPENALTGTLFMVNGTGDDNSGNQSIKVPAEDGKMRFWRNTAVATLAPGATYTLVPGSLGYEWDVDADNGFRPAGAFRLSTTTYTLTTDYLLDYGATYGAGAATHHMMTYRAPSGALVFGAGTVDWAYGLSSNHDNPFNFTNPNPDVNMQQATINLFADMGVQPASIQTGLRIASKSTDTAPPHSTILSPAVGANVSTGSTVTISGNASDTGGVVAGIEVSTDSGSTWHPADGRSTWTYSWTPTAVGSITLLSRAVDDTGNLETPTDGVIVSVAPQTCPCTIFGQNAPAAVDSGDGNSVELGVKFRADADGNIVGVRFYKSAANTGAHIGHVWSSTGQLLGTATFSGETSSGWQQVNFASPIAAQANTTYVASYYAPVGHYSADVRYFIQSGHDDPPLHALADGVDGVNGEFVYGTGGGFPTTGSNATNYWVDVIYASSNTYSITGSVSGPGGDGATITITGTESLSTSTDASGNYSFGGVVNGTYTVVASNPGVTFAPASQTANVNFSSVSGVNFVATVTNPLSISGTITGGAGATVALAGPANLNTTADSSGNYSFGGLLNGTYTVTPSEPTFIFNPSTQAVTLSGSNATNVNFSGQVCTCISIWQSTDTPAIIDSGDATAAELGVRFSADSSAYLTGIRFYKATTNTGTHVGHLWTTTGQLLGTATFPGETASGWQQGYFSSPVLLTAGTVYVASYFAPNGHYSATGNYFAGTGVNRPPLHALADGVSGADGIYTYTTSGAFPSSSFNSTNYWVDVLYAAQPHTISGTISGTGGAGATVALSGTSSATTTTDTSGNFAFTNVFSGNYSVTPTKTGYVFAPGSQNVSISQSDVTGINFSVPQMCPCNTVWQPSAVPVRVDSGDTQSVELGVKIRADSDGYILGVRFYKATTNTGTHIGNLWTSSGTVLATGTFTNETPSGWQQLIFANPVPVVANTTYVVSYLAPVAHYSADATFFASAGVDAPPLHALQNGVDGNDGVFSYGSVSTFPINSFNAANYWVDVIYAATATHTIAGTISGPGAVNTTVQLQGPPNASTTTDAQGRFNFNGVADGSYTLTPSQAGYSYTPAVLSVTLSGAHNLAANFTSAVPTFPVSGTVAGAPGVSVTLSGAATQTTTADASGNYNFAAVPNGTYTVTPSGPGVAVTPTSQGITVNGAAVSNVNFTAVQTLFTISGTVTGGAGTTVALSGNSSSSVVADSSGNYTFAGLTVGRYTVSPVTTPGIVFNPGTVTVVLNGTNVSGVNFTIPQNCPCDTFWLSSVVPAQTDSGDVHSVELGVKFRVDADAYITGLRFYKAAANTGTHLGRIWTSAGTLLGTATFTNESDSGWQQVSFSTPIAVAANTTYVASYFAPAGHYAADLRYFTNAGVDSPPVHALANNVDGQNGVFSYSATGAFPSQSLQNNAVNYWVDVIYSPTSTYSITGAISGAGGPAAKVTLSGASSAVTTADASGNFSLAGLVNGSYVVTPSATGYVLSPTSQNVTINNAHALALSFSSTAAGHNIVGAISGPGASGATVTLSGSTSGSTIASATGAFTFPALPDGTYTVAVAQAGYVYTPASQSVVVNGADSSVTLSSVQQSFSLSGTISGPGASGATLTLTGPSSATTTSNTSGAFSFAGLVNGTYTVAVSNAGFVFTPASQSVTINGANGAVTFSSGAQAFTLSGTITGAGASGTTVSLTGASTGTTTTNTSGAFSFAGLVNGTYTVAVSKAGFVFTPPSQSVTINGGNGAVTFSSAAQTFTLSGTITGAGGSGATVSVTGTATASVTANTSGAYTISGLPQGTYTVTPSKTGGFVFTPGSQNVTITSSNLTANFSSIQVFTISGTITGTGGNGATVTLTGAASATTTANASGVYTFSNRATGAYTVTPSKLGFVFTPTNRAVTITTANVTANFTSAVQLFTISGTISGAGGSGATVRLTGTSTATVTANPSGIYTFTGLAVGSYTVTPSKTSFLYTPASQAVTLTTANVTANFTTQTFTISGTISGVGGNAATVKLTGAATATVTASASGAYSFTGLTSGSYTVAPSKTGFLYTPASQGVTVTNANVSANFATQTFTISGKITGAGGNLATVKLTGSATATVTASATGTFSFTGLTKGTYTITPSNSGHLIIPLSSTVNLATANVTGVNFVSN